jgi:L-fuconolactonase
MINASTAVSEPVIEPALPIVDAHHHLWYMPEATIAAVASLDNILAQSLARTFRRYPRYLFDELRTDVQSGHNVRASVFVEAHAMHRAHGPEAMRSVGEIEFVNGVAAMADSGVFGDVRYCAAIVGGIDLALGGVVEDVLQAHMRAGGSRYRGVRSGAAYDEDSGILGAGGVPNRLLDPMFREGFKRLQAFGLSFDAFLLEPQLPDLIDLARAFPETQIILNHVGVPLGVGRYAGRREERFSLWRSNMISLSKCGNVAVKLGGLGVPLNGFESHASPASSAQLADEWRPYIETCIEAFGVHRCMFESNFPVDSAVCSYTTLWNTFKRLTSRASPDEKAALFSGTAIRIYRLEL